MEKKQHGGPRPNSGRPKVAEVRTPRVWRLTDAEFGIVSRVVKEMKEEGKKMENFTPGYVYVESIFKNKSGVFERMSYAKCTHCGRAILGTGTSYQEGNGTRKSKGNGFCDCESEQSE